MYRTFAIVLTTIVLAASAEAGVVSKGLREALEFAGRKFSKEVVEEGVERLSVRMVKLGAAHGDDVVAAALKRVGPRAGRLAEEAGEHGGLALRLLAKHGDDALPLVGKATSLCAVAHYGDEATVALLKHGAIGENLVEHFAKEGAEALAKVTPQNGRRLAMLAADGQLKPELMTVVRQYGDEACDFIWQNKGALATGAVLATFVASPEPYLHGAEKLTATVAEATIKPLTRIPETIAAEAAAGTNWTAVWLVLGTLLAIGSWNYLNGWKRTINGFRQRLSRGNADGAAHRSD